MHFSPDKSTDQLDSNDHDTCPVPDNNPNDESKRESFSADQLSNVRDGAPSD